MTVSVEHDDARRLRAARAGKQRIHRRGAGLCRTDPYARTPMLDSLRFGRQR